MLQHEFSIPVRDLDASGKSFEFPVRAAWLRGALEGTSVEASKKDGTLEVRLSKSGTDVVVRGTLHAAAQVPCARCLEPVELDFKESLSVLYVPGAASHGKGEEEDEGAEQVDLIPYDGENVVLDDLVRDTILLEIPMIPLCSETCPGISPQAPEQAAEPEPGIDPRLSPLLRLKKSTP